MGHFTHYTTSSSGQEPSSNRISTMSVTTWTVTSPYSTVARTSSFQWSVATVSRAKCHVPLSTSSLTKTTSPLSSADKKTLHESLSLYGKDHPLNSSEYIFDMMKLFFIFSYKYIIYLLQKLDIHRFLSMRIFVFIFTKKKCHQDSNFIFLFIKEN